jgi:hypothetical protein
MKRVCKSCGKKTADSNRFICGSCRVVSWRKRTKQKLVEFRGGKCENPKCGYDRCIDCLSFHHLDPSKKDFQLSDGNCHSFEKMKNEVEKCKMLCNNCHGEVHAGILKI